MYILIRIFTTISHHFCSIVKSKLMYFFDILQHTFVLLFNNLLSFNAHGKRSYLSRDLNFILFFFFCVSFKLLCVRQRQFIFIVRPQNHNGQILFRPCNAGFLTLYYAVCTRISTSLSSRFFSLFILSSQQQQV